MINRDILNFKLAINQALKNGWKPLKEHLIQDDCILYTDGSGLNSFDFTDENIYYESVIFSQDFAEYFFPKPVKHIKKVLIKEKDITKVWKGKLINVHIPEHYAGKRTKTFEKSWRYHLQKMVLEENPIDYLDKFII